MSGSTPDCGPHCSDPGPYETHCSCKDCHGKLVTGIISKDTQPPALRPGILLFILVLAGLALGICLGILLDVVPANASTERTITLTGTSHDLSVYVLPSHGALRTITTYYADDHYVHIDALQFAPNVRDVQMYTCVNPESTLPGHGQCDDHISSTDIDTVGLLGQPHTSVHHNVTLTFTPRGTGLSLHQGHFEHGGEPEMEFTYADGFTLQVIMTQHPWLYAINLYRGGLGGHSAAVFTSQDRI